MDKTRFITLLQLESNLNKENISLYDYNRQTFFELALMKKRLLDVI
jgi:hypothetical protein